MKATRWVLLWAALAAVSGLQAAQGGASLAVPAEELERLRAQAPKLAAKKIGIGFFQHLYVAEGKAPQGSGLDYAEDVMAGFVDSGLFSPSQLLLSNSPDDAGLSAQVASEQLGFSADGSGLSYFIKKAGGEPRSGKLALPADWDKAPSGASLGATRSRIMRQVGKRLALQVAKLLLGAK